MMKRILLSAGMAVFMGALVAGGTGAFFSDEETSAGNTFTAGALDLKVDSVAHYNGMICFDSGVDFSNGYKWHPAANVVWNAGLEKYELTGAANETELLADIEAFNDANPALNPKAGDVCGGTWALNDLDALQSSAFFNFSDLKPGDTGENTVSLHVDDNDAYMCVAIHNVESNENDCTEPEENDANDPTCGDPGVGQGELAQELNFFIWEDDGDNIYQQDEEILVPGADGDDIEDVYPLYTPGNDVFVGGDTQYLGVAWCYGEFDGFGVCDGETVSNISQTDSLTGDISFYVEQARNNEDFTCPDIDDFEGDEEVILPPQED